MAKSPKYKWSIDSDLYYKGIAVKRVRLETYAVTKGRAYANFLWVATDGYPYGYSLDWDSIQLIEIPGSLIPEDIENPLCPECGKRLDDSGCCPYHLLLKTF